MIEIQISQIIIFIGVLATLVSIITQVTKEVGVLNKIPTSLQVIVLSLLLTPLSVLLYATYSNVILGWHIYVASIIVGFIVAFVCMFGWEKLSEIYMRYKK